LKKYQDKSDTEQDEESLSKKQKDQEK